MIENIKNREVPQHVAIIMDGNGRWAESQSLPRTQGHIQGAKRVQEIMDVSRELGIKVITLFTFSTENWDRPENEIALIMNILTAVLERKLQKLKDDNIKLQTIGRAERTPEPLLTTLTNVIEETKNNTGLIVNLAFNYGARVEIVDAVQSIAQNVREGQLNVEDITEATISDALYTKGLPDPDLLIRTSGEQRISNFLLWQLSYAELYFTEKLWPDFNAEEFRSAIMSYQTRERRYGKVCAKESGQ